MSEFSIFDKAFSDYNVSSGHVEKYNKCSCDTETSVVVENGITTCTVCGEETFTVIRHDKEWRYYNSTKTSDPNRVHARKVEEKNISKDVAHMSFSDSIVSNANDLYTKCTNGQIYRGGSRKALIFACVLHSYKTAGNHQTPDNLIQVFGISRKAGLKGMKILSTKIPHDSVSSTTPKHIIGDIMNKFMATDEQKNEVYTIYDSIENRSSNLNRARPQSVAAAVIYYWIITTKTNITLTDFADKTSLSELTIMKNMKEIEIIKGINNVSAVEST